MEPEIFIYFNTLYYYLRLFYLFAIIAINYVKFSQDKRAYVSPDMQLVESRVSEERNCIRTTAVPSHWWGQAFGKGDHLWRQWWIHKGISWGRQPVMLPVAGEADFHGFHRCCLTFNGTLFNVLHVLKLFNSFQLKTFWKGPARLFSTYFLLSFEKKFEISLNGLFKSWLNRDKIPRSLG